MWSSIGDYIRDAKNEVVPDTYDYGIGIKK
jgi:hypothetical protein